MSVAGSPGKMAPMTLRLSALPTRCERWKLDGYWSERCGSFETNAAPMSVWALSTTQLLEPAGTPISSRSWRIAPSAFAASPTAGPAARSESNVPGWARSVGAFGAPLPDRVKDSMGDLAWIHSPMVSPLGSSTDQVWAHLP